MKKNILIIILLLILLFFFLNKKESYQVVESDNAKKQTINIGTRDNSQGEELGIKSSHLPKTNIRQGSDPLDGALFDDVILYKNDPTLDGEIGVEKCIKKCQGQCVEYGMTGESFCFPTDYANTKDVYMKTIANELSISDNRIDV
jgi:hypothetical protein